MGQNFTYYQLQLKLTREQLGTATECSIYHEHVLVKNRKFIEQANKLSGKVTKALKKYKGDQIPEEKVLSELQAVLRAYSALQNTVFEMPKTVEGVIAKAKEIEASFSEGFDKEDDPSKATVFLRDESNWPIISTHMVKGHAKEVLRTITNSGDKSIFKSKVQLSESMALDLSFVEPFARASNDIVKDKKGNRVLLERPLRFTTPMGATQTCISRSEQLPVGTEYKMTLRVRKGSPIDNPDVLERILDHGKALGLGCWRGSGGMGQFKFKLTPLPQFVEGDVDGWK